VEEKGESIPCPNNYRPTEDKFPAGRALFEGKGGKRPPRTPTDEEDETMRFPQPLPGAITVLGRSHLVGEKEEELKKKETKYFFFRKRPSAVRKSISQKKKIFEGKHN